MSNAGYMVLHITDVHVMVVRIREVYCIHLTYVALQVTCMALRYEHFLLLDHQTLGAFVCCVVHSVCWPPLFLRHQIQKYRSKVFVQGKVVFVAPTKPLVNQQIQACYEFMGVSKVYFPAAVTAQHA